MRTTIISTSISLILLFLLEIAARLIYPEFEGHLHSNNVTLGKQFHMSKELSTRVPSLDHVLTFDSPIMLVLGDSISHGYGLAYEDIYWVQLQRQLDLRLGEKSPKIVSLSYGGNNLNDARQAVKNFLATLPNKTITTIIYQFNFNDIVPDAYSRTAIQKENSFIEAKLTEDSDKKITTPSTPVSETSRSSMNLTAWRYKYLNQSVLFRVSQHYAGQLARKTTGTCLDRGLDALGPYTWSFGSAAYLNESNALWNNFSDALSELKQLSVSAKAQLRIFVSPLVFDIDLNGKHLYFNYLNYDFACAQINASERLREIARTLDIHVDDPTDYMRASFNRRVKEGNFTPFFFTADENHVTPVAATLMSEYLAARLGKQMAGEPH